MKYKFEDIAINSTAKKLPEPSDNEHYIGLEHLDSGNLYVTRWGADTAPIGEKLLMKKGDVLFGKRRAYQKKVGIAPFDGIFSAHGMVLRPKEDVICKEFFPFFISSDYFLNEAIRISVGGLSPTINWKDLRVLEFELPSLEEQRVLADKLWAAYEVKESYKNLLAQTDKLLHAQFEKMFGNPLTNSMEWSEYGPIPQYAEILLGSTPKSTEPSYWDGDILWITPAEMSDDKIWYNETNRHLTERGVRNSNLSLLPKGTVLLSTRAPIGKVGIVEKAMYCNQGFKNFYCREKLNEYYLFYVLLKNRDYLQTLGTGSTFKELSKSTIEKLCIAVPPMEKQLEFVRIAEQAERTKASLNKGIEAIEAVIRSLIAEGTTKV